MLFRFLRDEGWKIAFVPSLMMVNRETCDMGGFFRWVKRQLLTSRLYHPRWPAVVAHGIGTTFGLFATVLFLAFAAARHEYQAALMVLAGLILYQASMFILLIPIELSVRRIARARGDSTGWLGVGSAIKLLLAVPVTQFVYGWALAGTMHMKIVDWRGVSYRIDGPWDIRLIEYRPFDVGSGETVSSASL